MYLTKADIARLPRSAFSDVLTLIHAISAAFSVGITVDTAARILADFRDYTQHQRRNR